MATLTKERSTPIVEYSVSDAAIEQLRAVMATGCEGAIIGKALYEGQIDLREALAAARRTGWQ